MESETGFTGRRRRRQTSWSVRFADRFAGALIGVGGIGVILAVFLVCFFLLSVVVPLFRSATVGAPTAVQVSWGDVSPVHVGVDEYRELGYALLQDGTVQTIHLASGEVVDTQQLFAAEDAEDRKLTAWSFSPGSDDAALGFSDGSVRLGQFGFSTSFLNLSDAPPELHSLEVGEAALFGKGVANRVSQSQFRVGELAVTLNKPIEPRSDSPIVRIDQVRSAAGPIYCALAENGALYINSARERENLLTGAIKLSVNTVEIPLDAELEKPDYLLLSGLGDMLYLAWTDGRLVRFNVGDLKNPQRREEVDLVQEPDAQLTSLEFLIGGTTLLAGDSLGRVNAWFPVRGDSRSDGSWKVVLAHELPQHKAAVSSIGVSPRGRLIAAGYADGQVNLLHVTSGKRIAKLAVGDARAVDALTIAPKADAVLAVTGGEITTWEFDAKHPEVSLATLFLPVWYESRPEPAHVWQTSSANDAAEPKFGLRPLVFGTLKATFYSMLFGAPLAILAAVFTSEFLRPRVKARIKPMIEMMASLPSVVLGFLAGLVVAPLVESILPQVITIVYAVPLVVMSGAYVWQLLPAKMTIRLAGWRFLVILLVAIPLGIVVGWLAGPIVEKQLFAGDVKGWLNGRVGSPVGGWVLLFIPISGIAAMMLISTTVNPWIRSISHNWGRTTSAALEMLKFAAGVLLTLAIALACALLLSSLRLDSRGTFVGSYDPRNAMIVGFIMGFAIIPIIYTIADDALASVPEHLRSASLGAGATTWQTATRIVIPTAMSGLFSAVMIGLGRAVGETMIVLMAAGNTPLLEWNIFQGFQTLSAGIATELAEAPPGETHYRVLFLAAFTLFLMTFILNTIAEIVRLRFRRRAYEL